MRKANHSAESKDPSLIALLAGPQGVSITALALFGVPFDLSFPLHYADFS
jgi:hypothetical protein